MAEKEDAYAQAIRDLTFNIPPEEGGTYGERSKVDCPEPWHALKTARDSYGRYTVIYSFDAKEPRSKDGQKLSTFPKPFNDEQRLVMRRVMDAAEDIANIRFIEAGKKDSYFPKAAQCKPEDAHLCFFQDNYQKPFYGHAAGMESPAGGRDVIMHGNQAIASEFMHELSHAVAGISHPRNNPWLDSYGRDGTVMSANQAWSAAHFGQFDIITWQHIFGKSRSVKTLQTVVTGEEAMHTPVLHRRVPVTLNLRSLHNDQQTVTVDLARVLGCNVESSVVKPKGGSYEALNITFSPDTDVRAVLPVQNAVMHMRGKQGAQLTGDIRNDVLMAQGGKNILTGGGKGDTFRFDKNSGHGNMITDFTTQPTTPEQDFERNYDNDRIEFVLLNLDHVNLQRHRNGTTVQAVDTDKKAVASAFVMNQTPEQLKEHIFQAQNTKWDSFHNEDKIEAVNIVEIAPPTATPTPAPRLRIFGRRR